MTTYDMERPAAMPTAAPVGAVTPGYRLAAANPLQVHGTFAPIACGNRNGHLREAVDRSPRPTPRESIDVAAFDDRSQAVGFSRRPFWFSTDRHETNSR